jgi:hypothetical protein
MMSSRSWQASIGIETNQDKVIGRIKVLDPRFLRTPCLSTPAAIALKAKGGAHAQSDGFVSDWKSRPGV